MNADSWRHLCCFINILVKTIGTCLVGDGLSLIVGEVKTEVEKVTQHHEDDWCKEHWLNS